MSPLMPKEMPLQTVRGQNKIKPELMEQGSKEKIKLATKIA